MSELATFTQRDVFVLLSDGLSDETISNIYQDISDAVANTNYARDWDLVHTREPASERLVDHLVSHEIVWGVIDDPSDDPEHVRRGAEYYDDNVPCTVCGLKQCGREDEDMLVFQGRDVVDGEEFFLFDAYPETDLGLIAVPSRWITRLDGFGGVLHCTAWQEGIDPTSTYDGMVHVDPDQSVGLSICPIHEL